MRKWRDRPRRRRGNEETVSDIDLVILAVLLGNCNLPPQRMEGERVGALLRRGWGHQRKGGAPQRWRRVLQYSGSFLLRWFTQCGSLFKGTSAMIIGVGLTLFSLMQPFLSFHITDVLCLSSFIFYNPTVPSQRPDFGVITSLR